MISASKSSLPARAATLHPCADFSIPLTGRCRAHVGRIEPSRNRVYQLLHPAAQPRKNSGSAVLGFGRSLCKLPHLPVRRQHAARERAVLRLHLHQARQHGLRAQLRGVAAVDAAQQRIGETVHGFAAKMPLHQRGYGLIAIVGARRQQQLKRHPHLGGNTEEPRHRRRRQLGRHQEHEPIGQRHQAIAGNDIRFARGVVRRDQFAAQSQLAAKLGRRGFFRQEGIGPALQHRARDNLRGQRTAQPRPLLKERVFHWRARGARILEFIGCRQARNAAANDRNPHSSTSFHPYSKLRHRHVWEGKQV